MAETTNVNTAPLSEQEKNTVPEPFQPWSDHRALVVAKSDFEAMETARRTAGHDRRYTTADELFVGYQPVRYWEGTRVPRASIGVPLSMDQIEGIMPQIMGAIFPLRDNVQIDPQPGTSMEEAMATWFLIMSQLDSIGGKSHLGLPISFREIFRRVQKSKFQYGNGVAELTWETQKTKRRKVIPTTVAVTKKAFDSVIGQWVPVVVGEKPGFREVIETVEVNKPRLRVLDIRDFYNDPQCPSPNIQDGRFAAVRELVTVGALKAKRGQPGFNIPSDEILVQMSREKAGAYNDWTKVSVETYRGLSTNPQNDYTQDPEQGRIEVIRYYTPDRVIWLLNRNWLAYNQTNSFGFIPFFADFYVDLPNRWAAMSVPDVVEGEQRLQQGVINGRIDELALNLHPFWKKKRGAFQRALRTYPGAVIEMDNPETDLIREQPANVTAQAFVEVDASDRRAQKRTGVSDLAVLGTASVGGNSANRTATGVTAQKAATGSRIEYQIGNSGDNFIVPLIVALLRLNQMYLKPEQVINILGPWSQYISYVQPHEDKTPIPVQGATIINSEIKFIFRATERMKQRTMTLQVLPLILQTYMNPAMMQLMSQIGKTLDVNHLDMKVSDAIGWNPGTMWRDLNPQEISMLRQPSPADQLKAQMQDSRLQHMSQMQDTKDDTKLLSDVTNHLLTPDAAHSVLGLPTEVDKAKAKAKTSGKSK